MTVAAKTYNGCWWGHGEKGTWCTAGGYVKYAITLKKYVRVYRKAKRRVTIRVIVKHSSQKQCQVFLVPKYHFLYSSHG